MIVERHAKVSLIRMDWTAIDKSLKPNNYVFKFQETLLLLTETKVKHNLLSTSVKQLSTFVRGISKDLTAVINSIKYNVSNGITEGVRE